MEEQLISFETAKLAKLKGFNEATLTGFHGAKIHDVLFSDILDGFLYKYNQLSILYEGVSDWTSAPTQSLLQKWLREVHKLHLSVVYSADHNKYSVSGYDEFHWKELCKRNPRSDGRYPYPYKSEFLRHCWNHKTYEDALEFGLLEALKLIKTKEC